MEPLYRWRRRSCPILRPTEQGFSLRRIIHFHGYLRKLVPEPIEVIADTVGEAIKKVTLQLPQLQPNALTGYKSVQVAGCHSVNDFLSPSDMKEIHILPAFIGGKSGGIVQIIIGAILIAASFIPGIGQFLAPLLLNIGITLLIGGLLQLVAAPNRNRNNNAKSHYLGSPKNTVDIGTRIPILYGNRKVGGHYLSFNISAVESGV